MENNEKKLGGWNRLLKPLDPDAAAVLKTIKQPVERGRFLSTAIVSENGRKRTGGVERASAEAPAEFMRLTVSDDALAVVVDMPNVAKHMQHVWINSVPKQMKHIVVVSAVPVLQIFVIQNMQWTKQNVC